MATASPTLSPKRVATISPVLSRRRFKSSELPLTQSQHSAIDSLVHAFKKKGEFDVIRKQVYAQFEDNDAKRRLADALTELADAEFERNPSLLSKDRRQAAPLIEGAAERSEIYRTAEADVDKLIDQFLLIAEVKIREARKDDVGEKIANEEEQKGRKTDAEYALEAEVRRQARAKVREEEMAREREKVKEEKRKAEEERRQQQEEAERLERERLEQEEVERKKREAEREAYEKEMEERRERKKRQDAEWERERIEREEKERLKREKEREKQIEEDALNELLREGQALAAKSKPDRLDEYDSSSRRASNAKKSPAKEPAIAAIMRAEKLENEAKSSKLETQSVPKPVYERPGNSMTWRREVDGRDPKTLFKPVLQTEQRPYKELHSPSERLSRPAYESRPSSDDHGKTRHSNESGSRSSHHHEDLHDAESHRRHISERGGSPASIPHDGHSSPRPAERTSSSRSHGHREDRHGYSESRRDGRSRSPRRSHGYKDREERSSYRVRSQSPDGPRRRRSRSRDPPDIDRYVPSSSSRSGHRERDRDDERYSRDSEYSRDRDRRRTERTRDSDRHRDSERDYSRLKEKPKTKTPVEIDRYVPPGSSRKSIQEEEDRKLRKRELG